MYEARQNKEKVSRKIDTAGRGTRQKSRKLVQLFTNIHCPISNGQNSCLQLRNLTISDDQHNAHPFYDLFMNQEYTNDYHEYGHFLSTYRPSQNELEIKLPVSYSDPQSWGQNTDSDATRALSQREKDYFQSDIENNWSRKDAIEITIENEPWKLMNNIDINVKVEENLTNPFFRIGGNDDNVDWVSNRGYAVLSKQGYKESKYFNRSWFLRLVKAGALRKYNVFAHEAGHMFGLGDEYQVGNGKYEVPNTGIDAYDGMIMTHYNINTSFNHRNIPYKIERTRDGINILKRKWGLVWIRSDALPGTKTKHYDLVKQAFDLEKSNKKATMNNQRSNKTIMGDGYKVKPRHFVTFWDSMVKSIYNQYQDETKYPNRCQDWKIRKN